MYISENFVLKFSMVCVDHRRYAHQYNLAVLLTNHVVDDIDMGDGNRCNQELKERIREDQQCCGVNLFSSGRCVHPALGLTWSACITTRIFVWLETRRNEHNEICRLMYQDTSGKKHANNKSETQVRGMQIVFSPSLPQSMCYFVVNAAGIVGIPPQSIQIQN